MRIAGLFAVALWCLFHALRPVGSVTDLARRGAAMVLPPTRPADPGWMAQPCTNMSQSRIVFGSA